MSITKSESSPPIRAAAKAALDFGSAWEYAPAPEAPPPPAPEAPPPPAAVEANPEG